MSLPSEMQYLPEYVGRFTHLHFSSISAVCLGLKLYFLYFIGMEALREVKNTRAGGSKTSGRWLCREGCIASNPCSFPMSSSIPKHEAPNVSDSCYANMQSTAGFNSFETTILGPNASEAS